MNDGDDATCTATPDTGYLLASWQGDCAGTPAANTTCTLTDVQAPQAVSATFQFIAQATPTAPIPTMNAWMQALLGMLTVAFGLSSLRSGQRRERIMAIRD